ncbi:Hint domain-containing protein [Limobrevibacterium gyesilva]|nr:Hint domain-containing protein [Limobrevibacterium gyesilva]
MLADATIAAAGTYTVTIADSETITADSVLLNAANASLSIAGTLVLGGAQALLTLKAGALKGAGTIQGGAVKGSGGVLAMSGTLDGVTVLGTLAPGRFTPISVRNGLTVKTVAGASPGTIDLTGGALTVLDSETLDNVVIGLRGPFGVLQLGMAGGMLTLGPHVVLTAAGGAITAPEGGTLTNLGSLVVNTDLAGFGVTIEPTLVNAGTMALSAGSGNRATLSGLAFTNTGTLTLGASTTLDVANAAGSFANTGTIGLKSGAILKIDRNTTLAGIGLIDNAGGQLRLGGTLDLGGGTLDAGGTGAFSNAMLSGTVKDGTIRMHGGMLALPGATLDGITLRGTLDISQPVGKPGYTVNVAGGLGADTQGGTEAVLVNAAGDQFNFLDSTTLDDLTLIVGVSSGGFAVPASGISVQGGGTLTLGGGATLAATASAFLSAAGLVNLGQIQVGSGAFLAMTLDGFSNAGSIAIGSGGTLEIDTNTTLAQFIADAGTISTAGGVLALGGTLDLAGGTLDIAATGLFSSLRLAGTVTGGTIRPDGGTLAMGAQTLLGFGTTVVTGPTLDGITVLGTLDLGASSSGVSIVNGLTVLAADGGVPGMIDLTAGQLSILDAETLDHVAIRLGTSAAPPSPVSYSIWDRGTGQALTLGPDTAVTMAGSATISVDTLVNEGLIDAAAQVLSITGQTIRNAGVITLNGGTLELSGPQGSDNSGTIRADGASGLNLSGATFSNSGLLQAASGTLTVGPGLLNVSGTTLNGGTYEADAGATLDLGPAAPLATVNASIVLDGAGSALAAFNADLGAYQAIEATLKTIGASGTLAVLGGRDYVAAGSIAAAGVLQLGGGSLIAGGVAVAAGGLLTGFGTLASTILNVGTIDAAGGLLSVATLTGAGVLQVDPGATLELTTGTNQNVFFNFQGGALKLDAPAAFAGKIGGFGPGNTLILAGAQASSASLDGNLLNVTLAAGGTLSYGLIGTLANIGVDVGTDAFGNADITLQAPPAGACYMNGTRLLTAHGELPVEALRPGDHVVTLLGRQLARVRWIGHRHVDCRRHPAPEEVWPVRVQADAFGPGMPLRDLFLSPDHAVFVGSKRDRVLIPVRYLVNGMTVAQVPVDRLAYFHVELDRHDILLAEGLPAESYLDTGNRGCFANGGEAAALHPDFAMTIWRDRGCAPLVLSGPALAAARAGLLAQAAALGRGLTEAPDLHVLDRGAAIRPTIEGNIWRFRLPEGAGLVRLRSRVMVPAHTRPASDDHRRLGVAVARLRLDGQDVPAGDPRRGDGWHDAEPDWQWTNGDAALACAGARWLEATLLPLSRYWAEDAPPPARAACV